MYQKIEKIISALIETFGQPSFSSSVSNKRGLIPASVLIPLVIHQGKLSILFTRRTNTVRDHQGQISFPGGAIEPIDESPLKAAYRETYEEIGISSREITKLGELSPRETITGYFIYPYIGLINSLNHLHINLVEVERILIVPICWLMDNANSETKLYERPGVEKHSVIFYEEFEGEIIWGITAAILQDFFYEIKNSEGNIPSLFECEE